MLKEHHISNEKLMSRYYLSAYMVKYFPTFFNVPQYTFENMKTYADLVISHTDLNLNLELFKFEFDKWKQVDVQTNMNHINEMYLSINDMMNVEPKNVCEENFEIQQNILNIAKSYFKRF